MPFPRIEITVKYTGGDHCIPPPRVNNSAAAAHIGRTIADHNTFLWLEEAFLLCLNSEKNLIGWYRIGYGGTGSVMIDNHAVATIALSCAAKFVVLVHNHPSGNPSPSRADITATLSLKAFMDNIRIPLLDHIIITRTEHGSMRELNLL